MATPTSCSTLQQLHLRLLEARANTDRLFEIIREDSLYERPIPERHRIIFYIGHLEAFDWNLFRDHLLSLPSFSPAFDQLFAFGIDPVDGGLPTDRPEDWPSLLEVRQYVRTLRNTIDDALSSDALMDSSHSGSPSAETLLHTAIEHRLMHAETLAYMFHQLPYSSKHPQLQMPADTSPIENEMLEIPTGLATLGLSREDYSPFGWDNEFVSWVAEVPRFQIDKYMVTNAEFMRFVEAGGYQNPRHWLPEDWKWKERNAIRHPAFWKRDGADWLYRGMFEETPLPAGWPVYVSRAEAAAYARWANKSLPTEGQWHRAAYGKWNGNERLYPWGSTTPNAAHGNFDFARWDPTHVAASRNSQSDFGVVGQLGNGWEWTATPFAPFEGFQPFAFYPGYSANFFDAKHFVIKGGSSRTAACLLRRSFRNWFQPHYQYVYAGFRCVSKSEAN
jgi:ergothioneine biosynthesis protein EgtB